MKTLLLCSLVLLTPAAAPAFAGQCTADIEIAQTNYDLRINSAAAAGPSAPESTDAKLHHQPTQQSVGAAETKLGDLPPGADKEFAAAVQRARDADAANNEAACEAALDDAAKALKR
jgi:hypothetical protein